MTHGCTAHGSSNEAANTNVSNRDESGRMAWRHGCVSQPCQCGAIAKANAPRHLRGVTRQEASLGRCASPPRCDTEEAGPSARHI